LRRWARLDLIMVDKLGYLNLRPEQTILSFKLMEERYRRKPTIININHHQFIA
jgi:DNA replication protein DnaC